MSKLIKFALVVDKEPEFDTYSHPMSHCPFCLAYLWDSDSDVYLTACPCCHAVWHYEAVDPEDEHE